MHQFFRCLLVSVFSISLSVSLSAYGAQAAEAEAGSTVQRQEGGEKSPLDQVGDVAKDTTAQVSKTLDETRARRAKSDYLAMASYSPIDLLIPSKLGLTLGFISSADKTWELEYLRGSVSVPLVITDLGKMTDERLSVIERSYSGSNSFNFSYGLSYFDFSIHVGDSLLSRVSSGTYPSIDLIAVQALGFNWAFGNRWTFHRNMTFGVDWVSWAQPVVVLNKKSAFLDYASNQQDKDDVDKALKFISYFPRLAFFKLQFGILF